MSQSNLLRGEKFAVVGLGIMGSAMAKSVAESGISVYGVDPSDAARKDLKDKLTHVDAHLNAAWQSCDQWITSLPSPEALFSVVTQCEELSLAAPRSSSRVPLVIAETSTLTHADKVNAQSRLSRIGVRLLDCPLSGTGAQAKNRDLVVYASGDGEALVRVKPFFERCTRAIHNVGEFGQGTRMKLVANLLVALHNLSTAEALLFGQRMGLDALQMIKVLADGAGGSRMLEVRGPVMAQRRWSEAAMKVEVWQKDMQIIQSALREARVEAPLFSASVPIYSAAINQGHASHDTAAVYAVLERLAGDSS